MHTSPIADHDTEMQLLEQIATTGFLMAFGLRFGQPDYLLNRYPEEWTRLYERAQFIFGDPVAAWTVSRVGAVRWSDLAAHDPRRIMRRAAQYGLAYGATFVAQHEGKRSFLSVARHDRELSDDEMALLGDKLEGWSLAYAQRTSTLTDLELQALAAIRDGATQAEAARILKISRSTLKNRLDSAQHKLGATNTLNTVVIAVRQNLI